jgi:hypothetical protein
MGCPSGVDFDVARADIPVEYFGHAVVAVGDVAVERHGHDCDKLRHCVLLSLKVRSLGTMASVSFCEASGRSTLSH